MGSLTIIFILELITGFIAFFFVDKVIERPFFLCAHHHQGIWQGNTGQQIP